MNINKNNLGTSEVKKTEGGIIISKLPLKRSILAKKLLIRGENLREFEVLRAKIQTEVDPKTEIEKILCEKFISLTWKLQRAIEVEKNIFSQQDPNYDNDLDSLLDEGRSGKRHRIRNIKRIRFNSEELKHIIQYQLDLEKAIQKTLEQLRGEQAR